MVSIIIVHCSKIIKIWKEIIESNTMNQNKIEEIIIPLDLKTFLNDIADSKSGYRLGDPWKYSEETLGVVVPILRENSPDRFYITMYEVLDQLNIKDTGHINQVELQNDCGMAIFVRAGTIFEGKTQNRAAQHSGVYQDNKEIIDVRCVQQTRGISSDEKMKFGDIAPPSVTISLMTGDQSNVWERVRKYGSVPIVNDSVSVVSEDNVILNATDETDTENKSSMSENLGKAWESISRYPDRLQSYVIYDVNVSNECNVRISRVKPSEGVTSIWRGSLSKKEIEELSRRTNELNIRIRNSVNRSSGLGGSDNLLEKIRKSQSVLDDMMQKVPLFDNQVGAIIFSPVGVIAVETFDHPKSWEAIKKEIIEKYGDKIKDKQAEHIFELKPETILPTFKKFISSLDKFTERTIRKDNLSETREVHGDGVIGEYTLVKGQPIHVLLIRENV